VDIALNPRIRQTLELVDVVVWEVHVVERGSLDTLVELVPTQRPSGVDEAPPQPVVSVRVERQDAFARSDTLTQTTVELEEDVLLDFLRLVNPEESKVEVL